MCKYYATLDVLGCCILITALDDSEDILPEVVREVHKWVETVHVRSAKRFKTLGQLRKQ